MSSKNAARKPILQRVYDHVDGEPQDLRKKLTRVPDDFDSLHRELFPSGRAKDTLRQPQLFPGTEESDRHLRRVRTVKPVLKRIVDPIELSSEEEIVIIESRKASKSRKKSSERKRKSHSHRRRSRSSSRDRRRSRSRSPIRRRRSRSSSQDRRHKKHRSKKSRSQKRERRISRRKSSSRKISSDSVSSSEITTGESSTTSYLTNGERSRTESSDLSYKNLSFSKTIENPQKTNQKSDVWSEASIRNARLKMMILQPELKAKQGENRQKSPRVIRVGRKTQSKANGKSVNSATSSSEPVTGSSTESDADKDNHKFLNSSDIDYRKLIPAQSVSVRRLKIRGTQRKKLEKLNEIKKQEPSCSNVITLSSADESQQHTKSASEEGEILSDADRRKISVDRENMNRSGNASQSSKQKRKVREDSHEPTQEAPDWNDNDSLDALEQDLIDPLAEMDSMINHVAPGIPCEDDTVIQQQSDSRRNSDFGDIVQPEVYFDIFLDQLILDIAQDVFKTAIERECLLMEMTENTVDKLIADSTQEIAVRSAEDENISREAIAKTYCRFVDELVNDLLQEESEELKTEKKKEEILFLLDNLEDHDDCCLEGRPGSNCSRFSEALDAMDERLSNTWVKQLEEFDDITVKAKAQICFNELFSCEDFAELDHQGMIEIEFEQEDYEVVYKWPNLARKQRFLKRKSDQNTKSPIKKKLDELIAKSKSKQVSSMIQSSGAESNKNSTKQTHQSPKSSVQQRLGSLTVDQNLPVYDQETEDCFAATKSKVEVINLLSSDESEIICDKPKKISDKVLENIYDRIISSITSDLAEEIAKEARKEDDLINQVTEKSVLRIFSELYGKEESCMEKARESIESSIRELTRSVIQREINLLSIEDAAFKKLVDSSISQTCDKILEREKAKKSVAVDFFARLISDEVRILISAQMKKQQTNSDPVMKSWVCSLHDFSSLSSGGFNELKQHKLLSKSDFKNSPKLLIQSLNLSEEDAVLIERWWHEAQPKKFSISTLLGKSPSSSQAAAPKVQPGMTGAIIAQEQADVFDPLSALGLEYNTKRRQSIMEELNGLKYAVCDSKSPKVATPGKDKLGANSKGTPKDYRSNFQKGACSSNSNSPKSVSHDTPNTSSASSSVTAKSTPSSSKTVSKSRPRKLQRPTENVFDGIRRALGERKSSIKSVPSLCGPRKDLTSEDPIDCVDNFRLDAIIGEGTFGQVFRGECKLTKSLVALKKVRMDREKEGFPITAIREVKLLSKLSHRNVVDLRTVVQAKDLSSFFLVFEFVDNDLTGIIENAPLKSDQIKKLFYQILLGLEYCHKNDVFHRDLKCSNILIAKDGSVKLGDFGLARICFPTDPRPFTNKVITLWYRPPELLVGDDRYTAKIDMWSAGCILGEMFQRKPVFQASTDVAQLEVISKLCGIPDPAAWPEIIHYKHFKTLVTPLLTRFHPKPRRKIAEQFCALPPDALDVLDGLLRLNPKTRLSATEALQKPWFRFLSEDTRADLGSPENLHEMSARRKRKAKRQAKRVDSFSDKMAKIKRLTSSFPQLTLMILAEKAGIELTHEVRENLGSQRLSRIFGSTLPQQTIEPIADIVIQLASKNILIRKTARL